MVCVVFFLSFALLAPHWLPLTAALFCFVVSLRTVAGMRRALVSRHTVCRRRSRAALVGLPTNRRLSAWRFACLRATPTADSRPATPSIANCVVTETPVTVPSVSAAARRCGRLCAAGVEPCARDAICCFFFCFFCSPSSAWSLAACCALTQTHTLSRYRERSSVATAGCGGGCGRARARALTVSRCSHSQRTLVVAPQASTASTLPVAVTLVVSTTIVS